MSKHQLDVLWNVFGWVAAMLNVVGNLTLVTKSKIGWVIRIIVNLLWMPYGIYTSAWALCANHMMFVGINAYGWLKWTRDERREASIVTPGETPKTSAHEKSRRLAYVDGFKAGRIAERKTERKRR